MKAVRTPNPKSKPKSRTKARVLREIHELLYPIYRELLNRYFDKRIRLGVSVSDHAGTFAYDDKLKLGLHEGEPAWGKWVDVDEEFYTKKISVLSLVPLLKGNEIVAFRLTHNWHVIEEFGGEYSDSTSWIIAREPLKFKVQHNPPYREEPCNIIAKWEEEEEAIVDSDLFMRCLNAYLEAYRKQAIGEV